MSIFVEHLENITMAIKILISKELKEVLEALKSSSQVASLLLSEHIDDELLAKSYVNYLSISKGDPSKISYLSSDRAEGLDEAECWESKKRYQSRPGALVSKLFKGISGKEIETFSNLYISHVNKPKLRFEIFKGEDIKPLYHYNTYKSGSGSLGASCMKHDHCQNYFSLYTENPDNVSLVAMFLDNDTKCVGRALLWDFDSNKIMDRIYTINDENYSYYFKQWASENGYYYKSEQNWFNTMFFEKIGSGRKQFKFELNLKNTNFHKFPYMDTFKFMDMSNGKLYNYLPEDRRHIRTLCGSEGSTYGNDYLIFDEISLVHRYRNDAAYISYIDNPLYTGRDNAHYSNYNDRWILREHSVYNEIIGDYIFNEEYKGLNNPEIDKIIQRRLEERKAYEERLKSKTKNMKHIYRDAFASMDYASFYGNLTTFEESTRISSIDWDHLISEQTQVSSDTQDEQPQSEQNQSERNQSEQPQNEQRSIYTAYRPTGSSLRGRFNDSLMAYYERLNSEMSGWDVVGTRHSGRNRVGITEQPEPTEQPNTTQINDDDSPF